MMGFEWWFAALAILAAVFVAWPLLAGKLKRSDAGAAANSERKDEVLGDEFTERVAFNDALYAEQLGELEQQLESGAVSQAQYDKLKKELGSQHQQDNAIDAVTSSRGQLRHASWIVAGLAVALPIIAFGLYASWGSADDWQIQKLNETVARQQERGADPEILRALNKELFERLEERLEEEPDNFNNRFLLARTAVELGDFSTALSSYRYILERQPNSPQVMGEMAQVLFMAAGNRFTPEVQQLFDQALAMDPENSDLLGFAGIGAYQSGKYQLAVDYWQTGMETLSPGDPRFQTWQRAIAEAKRQLGEPVAQAGGLENEKSPEADGSAEAPGSLEISISLADHVDAAPGDAVFIYARAWQGAKMPLAMQQATVADLPLTLELDESMSMVPGMTMSRFPQLEVVARISSSGLADARSGDWQATAGPIDSDTPDQTVKLVIESQIP